MTVVWLLLGAWLIASIGFALGWASHARVARSMRAEQPHEGGPVIAPPLGTTRPGPRPRRRRHP